MYKIIIPVAMAAVLVISALIVGGCTHRRFACATPEKRAEFIVKRLTGKLDLTKEQVVSVNRIKDDILTRTRDLRKDHEGSHKEIVAMMKSDRLEKGRVNAFISQREEKLRDLKPFFVDKIVEFHSILTPAQRNKLAEKMEKFNRWCGK